jgi:hypothetical protein
MRIEIDHPLYERRKLECPGTLEDFDAVVLNSMASQGIRCALEQFPGDQMVEAGYADGELSNWGYQTSFDDFWHRPPPMNQVDYSKRPVEP